MLAAVEVGRRFGIKSADPVLIQESNNTVVWLSPQPVIAKVATRADSAEGLIREHEVAVALDALNTPVGPPLKGSSPLQHRSTGFTVTLWERLERDPNGVTSGEMLGLSLRQVHEALALSGIDLSDFRLWLRRARSALSNDVLLDALAKDDVAFLRSAFDALLIQLDARMFSLQPLHGEPHDGNRIMTPSGLRWIDFESVCRGPLEWDLLFLPEDASNAFDDVETELLGLLSTLNSARVATWCWIQWRFPEMRWHAEHHLRAVKDRWPST